MGIYPGSFKLLHHDGSPDSIGARQSTNARECVKEILLVPRKDQGDNRTTPEKPVMPLIVVKKLLQLASVLGNGQPQHQKDPGFLGQQIVGDDEPLLFFLGRDDHPAGGGAGR